MAVHGTEAPGDVCPPQAAGRFYPASREHLSQALQGFLAGSQRPVGSGPAVALVVPHAGYTYSGRIAGRAYACVDGTRVERAVVLAPSHSAAFRGLGVGLFRAFRTPLGDLPVDAAVCGLLLAAQIFVFRVWVKTAIIE